MISHSDPDPITAELALSLRSSVNADGGWGYLPSRLSRLEPTCWGVLALLDAGGEGDANLVRHAVELLAAWQDATGLLVDVTGAPPNFAFNGLAAVAISHALSNRRPALRRREPALGALVSAIRTGEGVRLPRAPTNRQDNALAGWPWNAATFSWVEPTSWCILALKKAAADPAARDTANRVIEAERMLADRCCLEGGWNYGNSNVLGKELHPYVQSSALALLALQDRRALPEVARSLEWLTANWQPEPSVLAWSLALLAMKLHRESTDTIERALRANLAYNGAPENLAARALASYALNGLRDGYSALAL